MDSSQLSKLLTFVIGDGFITKSDAFVVEHGSKQRDYLEWKYAYLNNMLGISNKIITRKKILASKEFINYGFEFRLRKNFGLGGIRKEIYGDSSKKNYFKILNKCTDYDLLLTVWLGDDGMVRRRVTNGVTNSAGLDIASFDQDEEQNLKLVQWFTDKIKVTPKVKKMFSSKANKHWYYISFSQHDSMVLWNRIRKTLNSIPSMKHKFRHVEEKYNRCYSYLEYNPSASPQRPTNKKYTLDDAGCSLEELIQSYQNLNSVYKVAEKYKISATAVKRMLKEAGVLRTQSESVVERSNI